uniref:Uncharacterized protein n=1 Tax=Spongospora subterranea TaxID=70186 RepID=A0A0H5QWC8_9EUKA|eukprot:CRZ06225.1 hypothetical protein [Spongospora subterranea]
MSLKFRFRSSSSHARVTGAGYKSRDVLLHFHAFLLYGVSMSFEAKIPYLRVRFGSATLRSNVARPISGDTGSFEFDGNVIILHIRKSSVYQGYPDIRISLHLKPPDQDDYKPADPCLGRLRIAVGHYTCENIDIQSKAIFDGTHQVALLMYGMFPIVPENEDSVGRLSISNVFVTNETSQPASSKPLRSATGFAFLRKDKTSVKLKKFMDALSEFTTFIFSSDKEFSKSVGNSILTLLEMFKMEVARQRFYAHLSSVVKEEFRISLFAFQTLVDVFRAVLREASNHRDFATCRKYLELSMHLKVVSPAGDTYLALYSFIKDHEVFKNIKFWELFLLDVLTEERNKSNRAAAYDCINISDSEAWDASAIDQDCEQKNELNLLVVHLLCIFAWYMLSSGVCSDSVSTFCSDMCNRNAVSEDVIILLRKFVRLLSFRTQFAMSPSDFFNGDNSNPGFSADLVRSSSLLKIFKTPSCDMFSVLELLDESRAKSLQSSARVDHNGTRRLETKNGWTRYQTPDGDDYFYNDVTNGSQWNVPDGFNDSESEIEDDSSGKDDRVNMSNSGDDVSPPPIIGSGGSTLISGEIVLRTLYAVIDENITPRPKGSLLLTTYRLIFIKDTKLDASVDTKSIAIFVASAPEPSPSQYNSTFGVHAISKFSVKQISEANGSDKLLHITLKDSQHLRYRLLTANIHTNKVNRDQLISEFCHLMIWAAFPKSVDQLFAFRYKLSVATPDDGWNIYRPDEEYRRMGVAFSQVWRRVALNSDYRFCSTYPAVFYVPAAMSNDVLRRISCFRSRARIPVLSYFNTESGAAMLRSAQPKTGVTRSHCFEDEQLILSANVRYIIDCRPKINARGNKVLGGGFESTARYPDCQVVFMGIENIHAIRESFRAMMDSISDVSMNFFVENAELHASNPQLADCDWNRHLKQVLLAASFTSWKLHNEQVSLLVHCSDGWDRTAQITSLSMMLMDPFFRSISGFIVLIEKEWISFGHKFHQRIGHGDSVYSDPQRSPIFIQFLDATWQLMSQFPTVFEFTVDLLLFIAHELFECKFGTFLCNSDRERSQIHLRSKTISLWTQVSINRDSYLNHLYRPCSTLLRPNCGLYALNIFPFYLRFNPSRSLIPAPLEVINKRVLEIYRSGDKHERNLRQQMFSQFREREISYLQAIKSLQASRDGTGVEDTRDWLDILQRNFVCPHPYHSD